MSYEPKEWACGDTITADDLNHIEDGIANADKGYECTDSAVETTECFEKAVKSIAGETFVVTVRTDENNNATADKTFEEIEQAWKSGSAITLKIVYSYTQHGVNFDECYTVPASIKTLWSDGAVEKTLDAVYGTTLISLRSTDGQIDFISCISAAIDSSSVTTQRGYRNFE